jgi:CubicO group peptidase (beta-lactamase class C family)
MNGVDEIRRHFLTLEAEERFSGVAQITHRSSPVFSAAFGYASRSWGIRNTLDTRFDTASITKLFTAAAILQLIDGKRLAFETGVIDFLGLEGTAISRDVNVYQLLTHSSGIGDDADEEAGESYEALWRTRPNYSVMGTRDFLPQFIHKAPNFPPGQGCRYCNCGYILLGLLIEKASGTTYHDYVRQNIFDRAGMDHSDFLSLDRVHENVAEGCDPLRDEAGRIIGWRKNIYSFPPIGSPDAGAYVTAGDLDRFLEAMRGGELLSPKLTSAFFTPQVRHGAMDGGSQHYGHGLWFLVDGDGQVVFCEKEGINPGVSGLIRHYPRDEVTVVLLSNMEAGVWEPVRKIHDLLIGGRWLLAAGTRS